LHVRHERSSLAAGAGLRQYRTTEADFRNFEAVAIKLEMLRCFAATARHGSLAAAAEALGRTPSAVSMMLAQFEADLAAPLFEGERKSRLTAFGRRTLDEAERVLAAFDGGVAAIRRHARSTAGTVRIAAVPSVAMTLLPEVITGFRAAHPDVRLELADVDSAAVHRRLDADEADLGLASGPGAPAVASTVLAVDPLGIVCRPDHPVAANGADVRWADLAWGPFIANPLCALVDHPGIRELVEHSPLVARNTTTLLSFVRAGLGATILPARVIAAGSTLLFLRPADPPVDREVHLLYRRHRRRDPAVEAFQAALLDLDTGSP
jgi:DNA-binding transcriptional LysR family regulator